MANRETDGSWPRQRIGIPGRYFTLRARGLPLTLGTANNRRPRALFLNGWNQMPKKLQVCAFKDCDNPVMRSTLRGDKPGPLLSVCKKCFEAGRPFPGEPPKSGSGVKAPKRPVICPTCGAALESVTDLQTYEARPPLVDSPEEVKVPGLTRLECPNGCLPPAQTPGGSGLRYEPVINIRSEKESCSRCGVPIKMENGCGFCSSCVADGYVVGVFQFRMPWVKP